MHELSLCLSLMDQLTRLAGEHGATGVKRVVLRIGPLAGVEPVQLAEAFTLACGGTLADGAELVTEPQPVRVQCLSCHGETETDSQHLICPTCHSSHTRLLSGDELILASVELELPS